MKYRITILLASILALFSCSDEKEQMKWVDLRYRVEDSYLLEASNPETISFLVKSTDPWMVYGTADWYTITPPSGEGDMENTTTVTIVCEENTDLDDRTDTIRIQSDYWIGKEFTITQKGIAYLEHEPVLNIPQEGGTTEITVKANQDWSAKVTSGGEWLSLVSGETGRLDGSVTVSATRNLGEQRTGVVTLYDRHGAAAKEVAVVQNGVILNIESPENGQWFRIWEEAQTLSIAVESNTGWTVEKANPEDDTWYSFAKTEYDGNENLQIIVEANVGTRVRTGEIILRTAAAEGAVPLEKRVRFKQANKPVVTTTVVNKTLSGGTWYGPNELMPARYNIYLDSYSGNIKCFFIWNTTPYTELRFHINDGKTQLSTTPWCSNVFNEASYCRVPVDGTKQNVLSFNIDRYTDDKGDEWVYVEWILNDTVIAHAIADGKNDDSGTDDTFKVPYSAISVGGSIQMSGTLTVSKWERVDHLVWGN